IVSEYIEGKTLAQLMQENPDKYDEYLEMFVDLQLEIHKHKAPLLNKLKDKMNRKISEAELDATTRYELHTRLDSMPKHNKVCHGDFNPSNIIITEDGIPYILDWSHATQGNASADVARTYLLFWLSGDISGAELYLDTFCKKSDTAKQYVQKWMPIVAASQSVKGNEKEREFLMSWVGVVDYQ
ncbi:MAG: aminoglycoside phosphotransferase family protein, partial [Clostridia bacterium]|nr:aminoglycoside phosphotransferase family protein [Clostridia bacterium]